jgi:hypothetical protein
MMDVFYFYIELREFKSTQVFLMIFDMVQNANTKDKFILKTLFSGWAEI